MCQPCLNENEILHIKQTFENYGPMAFETLLVNQCFCETSSVTNPVHGLPLTHHQRSLAHHMDSCTTLTVALHLKTTIPIIHCTQLIALNTHPT